MSNDNNTRHFWDATNQIFITWRNTRRQNEELIPAQSAIQSSQSMLQDAVFWSVTVNPSSIMNN